MRRIALWTAPLAAACVVLAAASPAAAKKLKAGVLGVGPDTDASGSLQAALAVQLEMAKGIEVTPVADMVGKLGNGPAPRPLQMDPTTKRNIDNLIGEAEQGYYEDNLAAALGQLAAAEAMANRAVYVPVAEIVKLRLWKCAVFLAMEDEAQAEVEALAALVVAPDLEVDLSVFRPSVNKLVGKVRAAGVRKAAVNVEGLPAGVKLKVDDVDVDATEFETPIGRHTLIAEAPGFKRVIKTFDVRGQTTLTIGLPLVLPFDMELVLMNTASRKAGDPRSDEYLKRVADGLGLDMVVLASGIVKPQRQSRVLVWQTDVDGKLQSKPARSTEAGHRYLLKWVSDSLGTGMSVAKNGNSGNGNNGKNGHANSDDPGNGKTGFTIDGDWRISARAGLIALRRARTLTAETGPGYDLAFFGAGPQVSVHVGRGLWFGEAELAWLTYDLSQVRVNHPQGGTVDLGGGTTLKSRLGGGAEMEFGKGAAGSRPGVAGSVGLLLEDHNANDVMDAGTPLGLFTSYNRFGVDLRVGGRMPLGIEDLLLAGHFDLIPLALWTETPADALGTNPSAPVAFAWRAGVEWAGLEGWTFAFDYAGEARSVKYDGQGTVPTSPILRNAVTSEGVHSVMVLVHRAF